MSFVPRHLIQCVIPELSTSEKSFRYSLSCRCANKSFRLFYPGQTHKYDDKTIPCTAEIDGDSFFLIRAICTKCGEDYLVFDKDFHGWDGIVCHDTAQAALPRPCLIAWKCARCKSLGHFAAIHISLQDKESFLIEAGGTFDENDWIDAFEWFSMSIKCAKCGLETLGWIDYETA